MVSAMRAEAALAVPIVPCASEPCGEASQIPSVTAGETAAYIIDTAAATTYAGTPPGPPSVLLPLPARGAELILFPGPELPERAKGPGDNMTDAAAFGTGGPVLELELAVANANVNASNVNASVNGSYFQDWPGGVSSPVRGGSFPVYGEEWAVSCLGLGDDAWECVPMVESRRDVAGLEEAAPFPPPRDRHGEAYVERLLRRGPIDWDAPVPLCDVPVFNVTEEQAARPGTPLHEIFSERFRQPGRHISALVVDDPVSFNESYAALRVLFRTPPGSVERPFFLRRLRVGRMVRVRAHSRLRTPLYYKEGYDRLSDQDVSGYALPKYPDPAFCDDPRPRPLVDVYSGEPGDRYFFARNKYFIGSSASATDIHCHRANWLHLALGFKVWLLQAPKEESTIRQVALHHITSAKGEGTWKYLTRSINTPEGKFDSMYLEDVAKGVAPRVCIQPPGTTMFIGDDWFHSLVNVGTSVSFGGFSQTTAQRFVTAEQEQRYFDEYITDVGGYTARSIPDIVDPEKLERSRGPEGLRKNMH